MQVIGFSASPRTRGNTAWTVETILEGAGRSGAQTKLWRWGEQAIEPCRGCNGCKRGDRRCVVGDGMDEIYAALRQADALVLGTPVYMAQMNAQAKTFADRLYALFSPRFSPFYREDQPRPKLVLAFTQGNPDAGKFASYFEYTREMFELLGFAEPAVTVVAGLRAETPEAQPGLRDALLALGGDVARA